MQGSAFVDYRTILKSRAQTEASSRWNSTCPLPSGPEMVGSVNDAALLRRGHSCVGMNANLSFCCLSDSNDRSHSVAGEV